MTWKRARKPEQIDLRRASILDAARRLSAVSLDQLSLRAIGRETGLSTSNLYRYFSSREAILLALLSDELEAWTDAMAAACADLPDKSETSVVVATMVDVTLPRERMIRLLGQRSSLVENTATAEEILAYRKRLILMGKRHTEGLSRLFPDLSPTQLLEFQSYFYHLVSATWHLRFPTPAASQAMADRELAEATQPYRTVLERGLTILLMGLLAEAEDAAP